MNLEEKLFLMFFFIFAGPKKEKNVHSHLAAEAKAALAATEDFSSVQLKKDNKVVPNAEFVPYKAQGKLIHNNFGPLS